MAHRVGILGLFGECNAFRAPVPQAEYRWMAYHEGASLMDALADKSAFLPPELRGFVDAMDASGDWEAVPLLYAMSESGPPLEETHLQSLLDKADVLLKAALPLDGIYITGHGSVVAQKTKDVDTALLRRIRAIVGNDVPIVETLDPHGKITTEMVDLADLLISYQTDPHTDMFERGEEAAHALRRLMAGERMSAAHVRLPILVSTAAIVAKDSPFRPAVALGQSKLSDKVASVSVVPGYPWTDTPFAGQNVAAWAWGNDPEPAAAVVRELSELIWLGRYGYQVKPLPLEQFAERAKAAGKDRSLPALCFADLADNPGGGATSNTMYAIETLLVHGVKGAAVGPIADPEVARQAHAAGVGAVIDVTFNKTLVDPFAKSMSVQALVTGLADGRFLARSGVAKGVELTQGLTAALQVNGLTVVVNSRPLQALAVEQFEMVGVDLKTLRSVVVKSRGHYQSSFAEFFDRDHMIEIDAPGWCTPHLERLPYVNRPDALFPTNANAIFDRETIHLKSAA